MSDHDPKLEALFHAAVKGQEKLVNENVDADDDAEEAEIIVEDEAAAAGEEAGEDEIEVELDASADEDEIEVTAVAADAPPPAGDVSPPAGAAPSPAVKKPAKQAPAAEAAAPKRSVQDALTEALIKAKQEALDALEQTQLEAKSLRDRLLRVSADFDNFKKRSRKQQNEAIQYANEGMLRELLPVLDNFERALEHVDAADENPVIKGIQMVQVHLTQTLEKLGLKQFSAAGLAFDPNLHEAVEQKQTDEHPAGQVVSEYQRGFMLNERLLRPAMVVVAMPPSQPAAEQVEESSEEPAAEPATADAEAESAEERGTETEEQ